MFEQHLKAGEYDTSISNLVFGRTGADNVMLITLSEKTIQNQQKFSMLALVQQKWRQPISMTKSL